MEEGIFLRKLAFDCEQGNAQEQVMKREKCKYKYQTF